MEIKKFAKKTYQVRNYEPFDISSTVTLSHEDLPDAAQSASLEEKYNMLNEAVDAMLIDSLQTEYQSSVDRLTALMKKYPVN